MTIKPISFAKGGKTDNGDIFKGIQNLLGIDENQMAQLWQVGIQKYGSEEAIGEALQSTLSQIPKTASPEEIANAVMTVFSPDETGMFKCGGKMQKLVKKHSKGNKVDCGCGGTKIRSGAEGDKLPKQRSEDKTVTIIGIGTPEQVIKGTYDYPSTNGEFEFGRYGKTANVWDNTGGFPTRYADEEWIRRHPIRQMIPLVRRKPAPEGFFENLGQRVTNRFPDAKFEDGGIVKGQNGYSIDYPGHETVSSSPTRMQLSITPSANIEKKDSSFIYQFDPDYTTRYVSVIYDKNGKPSYGLHTSDKRNGRRITEDEFSGYRNKWESLKEFFINNPEFNQRKSYTPFKAPITLNK